MFPRAIDQEATNRLRSEMTSPPCLKSDRLTLAPATAADVPALHTHWTDPEVRRYLWDGRIVSVAEVEDVIRTSDALFRRHAAGLWTVRRKTDRELVGCGGFWEYHEPPELEILLSISPSYWGIGYAQEAASILMDYAFDTLGFAAVQGSADTPNAASLRLMRRLGMRPAGFRPGEFGRIEVFRVDRDEWRSRRRAISGQRSTDARGVAP